MIVIIAIIRNSGLNTITSVTTTRPHCNNYNIVTDLSALKLKKKNVNFNTTPTTTTVVPVPSFFSIYGNNKTNKVTK